MFEFLKYENFPMIYSPDEGDASTGGDMGAGDAPDGDTPDDNSSGDDTGGADAANIDGDDAGDSNPDADSVDDKPKGDETLKPDSKDGDKGDKWREEYAGDDEKKLAFLNRISSQKDLIDKVFEQEKIIRSGKHKEGLAKDASEKEVAAFREKNGIPEKSEGYLDALPEGLVLGEDIKDQAAGYLERMHDMNTPPDVVSAGLQSLVDYQEDMAKQISARDIESQNSAIADLKDEWAGDYDANLTTLNNFIEGNFPQEMHDALKSGRLGDDTGTPLMSDPNVMKAFVNIQRQLNPLGTQTSGIGMDQIDGINDQIEAYEGQMGTKAWYSDQKAQDHYQRLVTQREKFTAK